jgi:hypothetical protein
VQAAPTARPKVPMRRRGADCSILAMKRGNARGAKGAGHRHWIGPTGNGRSLIISGRRQPSNDGTSRMNREVHVRICERLGVRFPGPTRQKLSLPQPFACLLLPGADTAWSCPPAEIRPLPKLTTVRAEGVRQDHRVKPIHFYDFVRLSLGG